jgi:hypothetical protein
MTSARARGTNLDALFLLYLLNDWRRVDPSPGPAFFRRHGVVPAITSDNRKVSLRLARMAHCLMCGADIGEDSTGDHIVALHNGGPAGVENYLPLCKNCNSSKGKRDLLEWWQLKGRRTDELPVDVLCAYVRLTYQRVVRCRAHNRPAEPQLTVAMQELWRQLPTSEHRSEAWERVQWVVGR